MKKWIKAREWAYRALRTFWQAFVGYVTVNLVAVVLGVDYTDPATLKTALIGLLIPAVSAGLAAIMNRDKTEEKT